jgi:hypothetical protein
MELFKRLLKKGCSKMSGCKASEILRSEKYFRVRRSNEERRMRERRRWAFFNSRLKESMLQTQGCVGVDCSRSQGGEE